MTKKKLLETEIQRRVEHWYPIALKLVSRDSRSMIQEANLAYKAMMAKDAVGLKVMTEVWLRSAPIMAKAVKRHKEYFDETVKDSDLPTPDTLLALFKMAQLSGDKDRELFAEWEAKHWTSWQVAEEVGVVKRRHPRFSKQILLVPEADVTLTHAPTMVGILKSMKAEVVHDDMVKVDGVGNGTYEVRLFVREEDKRKKKKDPAK